ncbi:isocitrate lyase/phosphoenolpyruvate mutase family protein [Streptomyces ovatisporus]|uniref:Isocitrate lyase/phosphoenolpyruvate mutase family protein n=1 Tax=Streptomyces ovatisporus TaxID=1128682 RepID=A0ABV9ABM0_9ACTN
MSIYETFRRLHRADEGDGPLLLPNAWDHASAAALYRRGFPAVGTTSLGVAAAAGLPDGSGAARSQTLALGRGIARLPVPVSVDIEGGFSDDPSEVASLAAQLAHAGVAGVNLEDGRADGTLTGPVEHAAKIRAVKEAAPELFVNARTDTYWLGVDATPQGALRRCAAYVAAGADGVFVPGLLALDEVAAVARESSVPLNVLHSPGHHTRRQLADAGVSRVSLGSLPFRAALQHAVDLAWAVAAGDGDVERGRSPVPGYAQVQALHEDFGRPRH